VLAAVDSRLSASVPNIVYSLDAVRRDHLVLRQVDLDVRQVLLLDLRQCLSGIEVAPHRPVEMALARIMVGRRASQRLSRPEVVLAQGDCQRQRLDQGRERDAARIDS
jgi:hypothetical protein